MDWREAGAIAREVRNQVFAGEDFQEGIRAFREKRRPRWPSVGGGDA
jgi:enoyl-CoA hydratase/carnithine racemase